MRKVFYASTLPACGAILFLCVSAPVSAQQAARTGKMEIPVQKSGKVVMADGSPLPEPVDVEAFCGSSVGRPIAKTDSKGGFIVGSGRSGESDARLQRSAAGGPGGALAGAVRLAGCTLMARLPGFQSSALAVVDDGAFDLGTITLSRRAGVEGSTFSATESNAPKDAKKSFDKAKQAIAKNKPNDARPLLEKVVKDYPQHASAWFELGRIHHGAKDYAQARSAYEQSIKADPKYLPPYMSLAAVYSSERNWKAASEVCGEVIKLNPFDYPAAYALHAMSNMRLGNEAAAEASSKKVIEMGVQSSFPEAEYMLGIILGSRGDTKGGAEHLTNFLRLAPNSPGAENVRKQLAEWGQPAPK